MELRAWCLVEVTVGLVAVAIALGVVHHEHWVQQLSKMLEEVHENLQ